MAQLSLASLITPNPCNPAQEQRNWQNLNKILQILDQIIVINYDEITNVQTINLTNINQIDVTNIDVTNNITTYDIDVTNNATIVQLDVTNIDVTNNITTYDIDVTNNATFVQMDVTNIDVTNNITTYDLTVTNDTTLNVLYVTDVYVTNVYATYIDSYSITYQLLFSDWSGESVQVCPPPCGEGSSGSGPPPNAQGCDTVSDTLSATAAPNCDPGIPSPLTLTRTPNTNVWFGEETTDCAPFGWNLTIQCFDELGVVSWSWEINDAGGQYDGVLVPTSTNPFSATITYTPGEGSCCEGVEQTITIGEVP